MPFGGNLKTEANKYKGSLGISELKLNKPKPATDGKHLLTAVYYLFYKYFKNNCNFIFLLLILDLYLYHNNNEVII